MFSDGKHYTGMTSNLKKRLIYHKKGKIRSTKNKKIIGIVELEKCSNRLFAREREKFWKSGMGRSTIKHSGVEQSGSSRCS
jgi:putative endonuclease